jgi:cell pole-organizing protein PopZ
MSEPTKEGKEPSMEEILASIRRIISEEGDGQGQAPARPAAAAPKAAASGDDGVVDLTQMVADDGSVVDVAKKKAAPAPAPAAAPKAPPPAPKPKMEPKAAMAGDLMSPSTARAAQGAFAQLAHAVETSRNPPNYDDGGEPAGGKSIEAMVYTILKPMLREWIDRNVPQIVERMVAREIDKMSSGG